MCTISHIWYSNNEIDWNEALKNYWKYVRPSNLLLEEKLQNLDLNHISNLDEKGWFDFLHEEYFRWKYTAPNRYITTTNSLKKYEFFNELDRLFDVKQRLMSLDKSDIKTGLTIAQEIHGLGIAGASGLLSLLYPQYFATVDQFVVKALLNISNLPEVNKLKLINSENLKLKDGILLIDILRRKAKENNETFNCSRWTPRKIDMVLWATRENN